MVWILIAFGLFVALVMRRGSNLGVASALWLVLIVIGAFVAARVTG